MSRSATTQKKNIGAHLAKSIVRAALMMAFCALMIPWRLSGQGSEATVNGTVYDQSGAILSDADITLQGAETGVRRVTRSNTDGSYSIPAVQPGKYTVIVSKTGFRTQQQNNLTLQVGQVAEINITLPLGDTSQVVNIDATTPGVETENSTLGTVFQEKEVVDLPLNGRMFTQLLQLAPGTVPIDQSQNNGKQPNFGAGAPTPAVNGQSNRSNLFFVDGVFASNPFFSGFSLSPSIDAIREFKAQTHADQAESGQSTGAIVSVVTKSGTNQFHGSLFEFFRNDKLDARNTFSAVKLPYRQNQFGATFGGPILKNKLFFFANYEGGRQVQPQPAYYTVPTAAQRNGDFSGVLGNGAQQIIYDPATFNPTTFTESPFPGNVIPTNRIDPKMQAFLNGSIPVGLGIGPNNLLATTGTRAVQDQGNIRMDYSFGTRDILFGRYSQGEASNTQPSALFNTFTTGFNGKNAGINWVHTYTPTLVSQVTVAYNSLVIPQAIAYPVDEGALFTASGLGAGFTETPGGTAGPQVPAINLTAAPGAPGYSGFWNGAGPIGPMSVAQVSGSVSKVQGTHNLKFGASYYKTWAYTNWNGNSDNFSYKGTWNAACQYAATNATAAAECPGGVNAAGGDPTASLLLSLPQGANRNLGDSGVALRFTTPALYAQDTWKVTPKLTLNYGLRWDYSSPVTEKYNRLPTYDQYAHQYLVPKGDVNLPSALPANVVVSDRGSISTAHYGDFSPRLGVAYQVTPKTVVRAGVGRTYDSWALSLQVAQQNRGGWPSGLSQNASSQDLNAQGISLKPDGTPYTGENPFFGAPAIPASPLPAGGLGFQDVRWKPAASVQWNIEVQQDLGGFGLASVAYVASQTSHITINDPFNLAIASTNPIKVYPDAVYGGTGSVLTSIGTAHYDSLQARLTRAYSNGFAYNAAFTWESSESQAVCGDFFQSCVQNPYNLKADYGPTSLDIPFIFTFSSTYELPVGKGKAHLASGPASVILGHWQVNGIFSARSGLPFNPCCVGDTANAGGGSQRYDITGNAYGAKTVAQWFNPAAFTVPASGAYGNAGINSLHGPNYWDVDFSVFRDFPFTEVRKLQFRSEFFNIFNHPNYSNPGCVQCAISSTTGAGNRDIQLSLKLLF